MIVLPTFAVLTGVIASAITIVARTTVPVSGMAAAVYDASLVLQELSADIEDATSIVELTPQVIELIVPDRTGNGADDRVRYAWSGNAGDPVTRLLNAQPVEILVPDVHAFVLTGVTRAANANPLDAEFAVLASHDGAPGAHTHDHTIEPSKWCAQYFEPSLPGAATEWKIKRVRIMAKREGDATSILTVRIETADIGQKPTGVILDEARIDEADLDDEMAWVDVDFTSLNELDPAHGFCLVIGQTTAGGKAAKIQYEHDDAPMTSGTHWLKSDNAGSTWSSITVEKDMRFYVLGTYDAYVPMQRQYLTAVEASMQPGTDANALVVVTARPLNPVEVASP